MNEINLDNSPCETCEYKIEIDLSTYKGYPPLECANCIDRHNWIAACLQKLGMI